MASPASIRERQARSPPAVAIETDITSTAEFQEILRCHEEILQPGKDIAIDFQDVAFSPDGHHIAGTVVICDQLKDEPETRLAVIDVDGGGLKTFGTGRGPDSGPKWSPDGSTIAFLSQVDGGGQLHLLDVRSGKVSETDRIPGGLEYLSWSQDGTKILLLVAGHGADKAGYQGGTTLFEEKANSKSWLPAVRVASTPRSDAYRTVWLYDLATQTSQQASPPRLNIWEATWISDTSIVAICSDSPEEEAWYHSSIRKISLDTGEVEELYQTPEERSSIAWLEASPSGHQVAFVQGVCSDRAITLGDLHILDMAEGGSTATVQMNAGDVNINSISWAHDEALLAGGLRDNGEAVILQYDVEARVSRDLWSSDQLSVSHDLVSQISASKGRTSSFRQQDAQVAFVRSGYFSPPTVVVASLKSGVQDIRRFAEPTEIHDMIQKLGHAKLVNWKAPDRLDIYGYFLSPSPSTTGEGSQGPHPTIMQVHGGPVWASRPRYIARSIELLCWLKAGFAIFEPNPRGSWGRGQSYARQVYGDMGGLDTQDILTGLDVLVESKAVDPDRIAVTGISYGGFMSSWIITQSERFVAAIPMSPVTNWVSQHYTCNIGRWCRDFLADDAHDAHGQYHSRSPLHHVRKVKTPTLLVCGTRDQCTPPGQALEFYQALMEQGTTAVLLTYPEEGHGVIKMPATIDILARQVAWFKTYLM